MVEYNIHAIKEVYKVHAVKEVYKVHAVKEVYNVNAIKKRSFGAETSAYSARLFLSGPPSGLFLSQG